MCEDGRVRPCVLERVCIRVFVPSCARACVRTQMLAGCCFFPAGPLAKCSRSERHGPTWMAQWPTETGTNNNTNVSLGPPVWSLTPPLTGRLRDQACPGRPWPGCECQPEWQPEWPATARQALVIVSMRMWTGLSHDRLTTQRHCRRERAYSRKPLPA